jgi:hypothetical protein
MKYAREPLPVIFEFSRSLKSLVMPISDFTTGRRSTSRSHRKEKEMKHILNKRIECLEKFPMHLVPLALRPIFGAMRLILEN